MNRVIGTPGFLTVVHLQTVSALIVAAAVLGGLTGLAQAAQLTAIAEPPPRASRAGCYMLGAAILGRAALARLREYAPLPGTCMHRTLMPTVAV